MQPKLAFTLSYNLADNRIGHISGSVLAGISPKAIVPEFLVLRRANNKYLIKPHKHKQGEAAPKHKSQILNWRSFSG
jgi:hypothetical protein